MRKPLRIKAGLESEAETRVIALSIRWMADAFVLAEAVYLKGVVAAMFGKEHTCATSYLH